MFHPQFNFPEETFSKIGHKFAKTCSFENFFYENILYSYLTRDRWLERRGKKQGKGSGFSHFSDQYFLPCFLCKHPTIMFQKKNGYFNIKIRLLIRETKPGKLSKRKCLIIAFVVFFFSSKYWKDSKQLWKNVFLIITKAIKKKIVIFFLIPSFWFFDNFN